MNEIFLVYFYFKITSILNSSNFESVINDEYYTRAWNERGAEEFKLFPRSKAKKKRHARNLGTNRGLHCTWNLRHRRFFDISIRRISNLSKFRIINDELLTTLLGTNEESESRCQDAGARVQFEGRAKFPWHTRGGHLAQIDTCHVHLRSAIACASSRYHRETISSFIDWSKPSTTRIVLSPLLSSPLPFPLPQLYHRRSLPSPFLFFSPPSPFFFFFLLSLLFAVTVFRYPGK